MEHTKGELKITEGIKIYIVPVEADEIICEVPYDYAKDFDKTEQELLANANRLVKCWNSHDDLLAALEKYGKHKADCARIRPRVTDTLGPGCTCDLEQAIAKAKK